MRSNSARAAPPNVNKAQPGSDGVERSIPRIKVSICLFLRQCVLFSKFAGTYESEFHGIINSLIEHHFDVLNDIGCDEGYYAVGVAMRNPEVQVIAFDTDECARCQCKDLGDANGVGDQLLIQGHCGLEELLKYVGNKRSLIISDCEGYELDLFAPNVISYPSNATLLIEAHDAKRAFSIIEFQTTHHVMFVDAITDFARLQKAESAELLTLRLSERYSAVREWRGEPSGWLFCTLPQNTNA